MKKFFTLVALLSLAVSAHAVTYPVDRPARIGHRGANSAQLSDENTLEALQLAVQIGVDILEFDIQRTSDDVFVIMHDVTVNRTTDGTGRVDEMTLAEFKALHTQRGYTPPTLDEVLIWLEANKVDFILDCKITDSSVIKDLIGQVESHGLIERAVFESPDPKIAGMVEKMWPQIDTAVYPVHQFLMRYYLNKYDIDIGSYNYLFANPIEIALVQKKGKKVVVWTVNKKMWIKWFNRLEVDGIMSNDPNIFE